MVVALVVVVLGFFCYEMFTQKNHRGCTPGHSRFYPDLTAVDRDKSRCVLFVKPYFLFTATL